MGMLRVLPKCLILYVKHGVAAQKTRFFTFITVMTSMPKFLKYLSIIFMCSLSRQCAPSPRSCHSPRIHHPDDTHTHSTVMKVTAVAATRDVYSCFPRTALECAQQGSLTDLLNLRETYARLEVFTAVTMKNTVLSNIQTQFVLHRRHITSPLQSSEV
jgi:hypothetical protein